MYKIIHEELNNEFNIWVILNEEPHFATCPILLEGYKKVCGGIKYLVKRYQKFDIKRCYEDISKDGYFSKRPYQLAQACDGSITNCVLALYYNFCIVKNLSPSKLLDLAYPKERGQEADFVMIKKLAEWESVTYPKTWNNKAFEGLLESLTQINYHSLVNILSDINIITE